MGGDGKSGPGLGIGISGIGSTPGGGPTSGGALGRSTSGAVHPGSSGGGVTGISGF